MSTNLEQSIIKTLAFFDIFDYPLTLTEIWKWLYRPNKNNDHQTNYRLSEIKNALEHSLYLRNKIDSAEGFYSLKGREAIYLIRKQHNNLSELKFKRAVFLAKMFKYLPFIKLIAVCNSLAFSNAKEESDIDIFIITAPKKMWVSRFFTILILKILRLRPKEDKISNTFCLSFFVDERYLNIKDAILSPQGDIYYPYWLEQLMPIYDPENIYEKFLQANQWYKEYLPNGLTNQFVREIKDNFFSRAIKKIFTIVLDLPWLGTIIDNICRRLQVRIIDHNMRELVNIDTRVVINDQMLKFHVNDRREFYFKKWRERLNQLDSQQADESR